VTALAALAGWCVAAALAAELRRRSGLVADASHELRGPLTAIALGLEGVRRQPATRRRADALLAELGRMETAADDVAAAARGRRSRAAAAPVELRELVERTSEAWRAPAALRGGRVLVDWQAGPAHVRADPRRLAQALANLLANAVEHGGGEVVVRGRRTTAGVRVEVADRGRRGRGRGLVIAERAIADAGGGLGSRERPGGGHVAVAELPVERVR
jgi:two-component system sensor histidine kinase MtrB